MGYREITGDELEQISGGSITNTYSRNTKIGTVYSDITGETYHYDAQYKGQIYEYLSAHRGDTDADNMNYLRNQGWVY